MKSLKLIGLIFFLLIIQISKAKSTDCDLPSIEYNIESADLIFIGELISENEKTSITNEFEIAIDRILKNNKNYSSNKIKIISYDKVWMCGASIPEKEKQLIFATWNEKENFYTISGGNNFSIGDKLHAEKLKKAMTILTSSSSQKIINSDDNKNGKWFLFPIGLTFVIFYWYLKKK